MPALHLRVLDVSVSLEAPEAILLPVRAAYRRFETPGADPAAPARLHLAVGADGLRVDERTVPLIEDLDPTLQVYQQLLAGLMHAIGSHAVLHAAALVDGAGRAVLIGAPSGHGKSSLTLELASRGLRFLGDDYAPLDLERATVSPYPRAIGIIPREEAPIPETFRRRALDPGAARLFGKALIDPGDALGEGALVREPVSIGHVILLTASGAGASAPERTWLHLGAHARDREAIEERIDPISGVEIVGRAVQGGLATWALRIEHAQRPTGELSRLLDDERVLFCEKHWEARPDFAAVPRARPVARRLAAEYLGRELLNRRDSSRLMQRHPGGLPELFLALAGALREASCWQVEVGSFAETTRTLLELVSGEGPRIAGRRGDP